jgi:glycosyltransferase involved in cell wall biosynthesis
VNQATTARPMKILFSVPGYKPAWRLGGPVVSVPALAEALVQRGHEVTVFATNSNLDQVLDVEPNRPHDVNGVEVWYFEKEEPLQRWFPRVAYLSKSLGLLYSPKMGRELARRVPAVDLVHTHLPFNYPTYAAAKAAHRLRKPLFYHQRGVFDPERLKFRALKKTLYLRGLELPIARRATTLIALTEAEADSYRLLGLQAPIRVIPNGVALPAAGESRQDLVEALGIRPGQLMILFMGRVHPIKGADKLLEAFLKIRDRVPDAVLVLAGPDEFGLEKNFRARALAEGADQRVLFPGMVEGELKRALLKRADLFCLPSDAEGFSMAILEALAAGTAVLISPRCHFAEVERANAGIVVQPEVGPLANTLADLAGRKEDLVAMGRRGAELVRARYTWDSVAEQMIGAYQEGVARHLRQAGRGA